MLPLLLFKATSCFQLWLFAYFTGLRIGFGDLMAMQGRGCDIRMVVRILHDAQRMGLEANTRDIEQAESAGVSLNAIHRVLKKAQDDRAAGIEFQNILDAAKALSATPPQQ